MIVFAIVAVMLSVNAAYCAINVAADFSARRWVRMAFGIAATTATFLLLVVTVFTASNLFGAADICFERGGAWHDGVCVTEFPRG